MNTLDVVWSVARVVLVALLLVVLLIRMFEDRLIFFPNYYASGEWDTRILGLETEDVFFTTAGGVRIHAWWAPARAGESSASEGEYRAPQKVFTILYFHGNAGNLTNRAGNILFLTKLPANVLAVDYRGYGKSESRFPSEQGIYRDAQAAYDYLVSDRGIAPEKIVVLGQSLGTAVAVDLVSRNKVAALVLEAGFPSARRVAPLVLPIPGLHYIMRSRFDSASKLKTIQVPVLVAHCTTDPVMPFKFGEELFAAANQPKVFVRYQAACHEPLYDADAKDYAQKLRELLESARSEHRVPDP